MKSEARRAGSGATRGAWNSVPKRLLQSLAGIVTALTMMTAAFGQICIDPQQTVAAGFGGSHLAVCDVDGDADTDLISVSPAFKNAKQQ